MKTNQLLPLVSIALLLSALAAAVLNTGNYDIADNKQTKEKDIEKIELIHYLKPKNPAKEKTENCYKLMGVKWTHEVRYTINPTNSGLDLSQIEYSISSAAEEWDKATSWSLFSDTYTIDYTTEYGIRDEQNTIAFGDYSNNNVIAVTSIWFTRKTKEIIEFDILFNTRFQWGDASNNSNIMDLQNIATHELGHSIGLNDLYATACSQATMYGYSTEGETNKRTLEKGDILGLQKIYST